MINAITMYPTFLSDWELSCFEAKYVWGVNTISSGSTFDLQCLHNTASNLIFSLQYGHSRNSLVCLICSTDDNCSEELPSQLTTLPQTEHRHGCLWFATQSQTGNHKDAVNAVSKQCKIWFVFSRSMRTCFLQYSQYPLADSVAITIPHISSQVLRKRYPMFLW